MSQKLRIQNAILDTVLNRDFQGVVYDASGRPTAPKNITAKPLIPVLCNEVGATFEDDEDYGRGVKSTRGTWTFALRIRFPREVMLEDYEEELMNDPPRIPFDGGYPYVQIRLTSTEVQHPVQQQSATGTIAEFTFQAQQGRR